MRSRKMASKVNFVLVAGLMAVAAGSSGCRLFKKKSTAAVKSTVQSTRLGDATLTYNSGGTSSTKIADTNDLIIPFVVNDATVVKGLGSFSVSISSDDSNFFSSNPGGYEITMKLLKNGAEVIPAQAVKNGDWSLSADANVELNNGDRVEVVLEKVPASFIGFEAYVYAGVQLGEPATVSDSLAEEYASWRSGESGFATDVTKDLGGSLKLPRDSLWEFSVNSSPTDVSKTWKLRDSNGNDCGAATPLDGTMKLDFSRTTATSPRKTVKEMQDLNLGELTKAGNDGRRSKWADTPCGLSAAVSLEASGETMTLAGQITGLRKDEQFVSTSMSISTNFGNSGQLPLVDTTIVPGPPNGYESKEFGGKIDGSTFKVKMQGNKKEGLSVSSYMSFYYPVNSPVASIGDDEWQKIKAVGKGMAVDASGNPVDVPLTVSWGDRTSLSFEETKFIDLADGGKEYVIEFTFPDSMKGAYASVSVTANKMFEFLESMQARPGSPASVTKEANRNQMFAAFQAKADGYAASPANFKPVGQWYGPAGEPPDYKSDDKSKAKQMDVAKVLAAMEAIRNTFHTVTEEGIRKGDLNQVDRGTIESCLGNTAPHWSDITIHYYCAHSFLRGCYTGGIRTTAGFVQAAAQAATDASGKIDPGKFACAAPAMDVGGGKSVPVVPGLIRAYVWQKCSAAATDTQPDMTPPATLIPGAPGGAGCPAGLPQVPAYVASEDDRKAFSWITASQDRAEMFRYMMDAPTFGLSDQDQQDVINAFWRVKNPADKDECNAKRPRRAIDPFDGTHCLAGKVYSEPMAPTKEGR